MSDRSLEEFLRENGLHVLSGNPFRYDQNTDTINLISRKQNTNGQTSAVDRGYLLETSKRGN